MSTFAWSKLLQTIVPERMLVLEVQAFDWNCPQHITPRFTVEEVEAAFAPQKAYVAKLEAENLALRAALAEITSGHE